MTAGTKPSDVEMIELPTIEGGWPCLLVDPPWEFKEKPGRNTRKHYPVMGFDEIINMPVRDIAAKNCHLFLWSTGPHLIQAIQVIYRWGFKYSGMGFVWVKMRKGSTDRLFYSMDDLHVGLGLTTRHNAEYCLLSRRGAPKRIAKDVREIILAPVREHSRKPDEIRERIEAYCDGPRLELFPGLPRDGWTQWGNPLPSLKVVA
jgi:N6-adenosine-specific RNA methylase IME4